MPFKKKLERWIYQYDEELINSPNRRNQDAFIIQIIFANAFTILTGGEFMTGFAIHLGAPDTLLGYIPLLGNIGGISLIFFGVLLEQFTRRKKLAITLNSITKPLLVSVVLIPLFVPKHLQATVLFIILFVAYTLNSFLGLAVNSWFVNIIPIGIRGRYFSVRQIYAVLVMVFLPVIGGSVLDVTHDVYWGFVIVFAAAFLFGGGETFAFSKLEDAVVKNMGKDIRLLDVFRIPIKDKEFMGYTIRSMIFHIVLYLSASYSQVYMIKYLGLSYTFITSMIMLNAVVQMIAYSRWGRIGDKYGHDFVIGLSFWFYAAQMLLWALTSKGSMYITVPLVHIISSFSSSGYTVGSFNHRYSILPEKGRSFYDAFYSAAVGVALIIGPWAGGRIKDFMGGIDFIQTKIQFGEFRIIFAMSALGLIVLSSLIFLGWRKMRKESNEFL
ncbi:MAG: MFS transporter [Clostridiales bacterium]|nr:MFS transporter [Clostridiales bacterium]